MCGFFIEISFYKNKYEILMRILIFIINDLFQISSFCYLMLLCSVIIVIIAVFSLQLHNY